MATIDGNGESTYSVTQNSKAPRSLGVSVTYGRIPRRHWGIRFDYVGLGYLISIGVSSSPAFRIIVLGCSLWIGKVYERVKEVELGPTFVSLSGE